ncbi:MAG: Gfo/Idh/MocA family oxidoreductase [Clostridia bacterium]|nr:Gfo/Idh/MocA family oxidoreductase [Clostridia bacterium]
MSNVRFGVIGCGNIARAHMWALKNGEGIECYGLYDRIKEHAEKLNGEFDNQFKIFDTAEEMLTCPEIDAVILAVPNYQHHPMFMLAAQYGKHIVCEKPLTMSVELGKEMVEAAKKAGIKTQMGLCTRFEPFVDAMMDHIQAGNLGEVYFIRTEILRRRGAPTGWFGNKEKSGGGPLIDLGVHVIDAAWYLMGKPKPVSVKALNYQKIENKYPKDVEIYSSYENDGNEPYTVEDSTHGIITFEGGKGIMYQASWSLNTDDVEDRMELYGSKGGFIKNPCKLIREEVSGMTETTLFSREGDCYTRQLEDFARVVKGEKESRTPVEDGLQIQKILNGLYESARTGKEVEI